jgi:hypothetical protein
VATFWHRVARFMAEYHRFCAALDNQPQPLTTPPIPEPAEALQRLIDPRITNLPRVLSG